ncbi:MAG: hypothetical protein ACRCTJ_06025, partial [Brevinema sp.]
SEFVGTFSYRISNNKVTRKIFIVKDESYKLQAHEVLVSPDNCQKYYPITSSAKKVIERYLL